MVSSSARRPRSSPAAVRRELERANRTLRLLSDANQALIRAVDEAELLRTICELVTGPGGYRMAWVGLADDAPGGGLRPVAHAGLEEGYLDSAPLRKGQRGDPATEALRTGRPVLVRRIASDPRFARRRAAALRRGYLSALALPLADGGRPFGVLKLLSAETDAFDAREVAVLSELAGDLAFGLSALRTRADLRSTARQLGTVVDSVPDLLARFDLQGRFTFLSPSVERSMGASADRFLGRTVLEVGVSDDPALTLAAHQSLARVLAGGPPERLEVTLATPRGPRLHELRHIAERDEQGRVVSALGLATDLTERAAARRQIEVLSRALDSVQEGVFLFVDEHPRFEYVNRSAAEGLGYTREELTSGMTVLDIDPDLDLARWQAIMSGTRSSPGLQIETRHRARDGRVYPVEVTGNAFAAEGHRYYVALTRDITGRRAAEEALRVREAAYRTLAENLPDLIMRWDRQLTRTYVNPAFARALGRPAEALEGKHLGEGYLPELADANQAASAQLTGMVESVFRTGEPQTRDLTLHQVDGVRTYQSQVVPERDAEGRVATVLGIARDITALKETERQFRTLAEHSPDVIFRLDREGRYLYANPTLFAVLGRPPGDHLGRPFGALTGDPGREPYAGVRRRLAALFGGGVAQEMEFQETIQGERRDFNLRLVPEKDPQGQVVTALAVMRDVTAQKRAAAALEASELRFRQVTETIDEVFFLTDAERSKVLYVSPAYQRVFGQPRELLATRPTAWVELVHPEDREKVLEALRRGAEEGQELEYRVVRPEGVRWIRSRSMPVRDEQGVARRVAGVATDVTARRQLEEQLRQAQKLEAVGRLAGGIAHDFNNLLAVIELQATLLLDDPATPAGAREGLEEIQGAGRRAGNLTRQLLTFSRSQPLQPVDLDLGETVAQLSRLLRRVLGERVALETGLAPGLPRLRADAVMMEQVVLNLVLNARDAMPDGGRLRLELQPTAVSAAQAAAHPGVPVGPALCLTVTDSGAGIPPEALPHLFEPFFTTKAVGKGTGLGLATVFGIVQQHQGWIEVESELGKGSTFRVVLPALAAPPALAADAAVPHPSPSAPRPEGLGETVLLVEDEAPVRAAARAGLERLGYRVHEAASGPAALALWRRLGPRGVDLLFTDLVMPEGMSGVELAAALRAQAPGLRVLFTSGHGLDLVGAAPRPLLQKPYSVRELAQAVRRALLDPAPP